jgi:glutathione synthase/RimK-type ligase-like ATP-grasp enzyme
MQSKGLIIAAVNLTTTILRLQDLLHCNTEVESFNAKMSPVIRWGSSYSIRNAKHTLNTMKAVGRTKNKLKMLDFLRREGISVPNPTDEVPCVARWKSGSRGSGICFCRKKQEKEQAASDGAEAFLEWVSIKKEYRVHVVRGLIISFSEKKKTRHANPDIRGAANGWDFHDRSKVSLEDALELISSSLAAVQALKLDFGAVDIAMTKENMPVVFEVNSAPGLNEKHANAYAKAFEKWLDTIN